VDVSQRKRAEEALEKRVLALTRPLDDVEGIAFEDLFSLPELQRLQDLFANVWGVAALITRPDGTPITQPSNFTYFCSEFIRKNEKGLRNCRISDATLGRHNPSGPIIHACLSAGLWGAGASITVGGRHIASWLIGQVRNEAQSEERIIEYARVIGADEAAFREAFARVPVMSRKTFEQVAHSLFALANQLSTTAYQNIQQARFIAERKRAEEALRESEEKFRGIYEACLSGLSFTTGKASCWTPTGPVSRYSAFPMRQR
jgi:ligand-binding sensor protein